MKVNDAHVHFRGTENAERVLEAMDAAGIDKIGAISPRPGTTASEQIAALESLIPILRESPDRFFGLAYINPLLEDAPEIMSKAVNEWGYRGVKMIPDHWYPYDERFQVLFETIEQTGISALFHSGILWGNGDSSRFCRPVDFEVLINYPRITFALAHIGWPWTDECIALAGRFSADIVDPSFALQEHAPRPSESDPYRSQMYIDITMGAPRPYRREAIAKALAIIGDYQLLYGSDCDSPEDPAALAHHARLDEALLKGELGQPSESVGRIMHDNFEHFFKLTS